MNLTSRIPTPTQLQQTEAVPLTERLSEDPEHLHRLHFIATFPFFYPETSKSAGHLMDPVVFRDPPVSPPLNWCSKTCCPRAKPILVELRSTTKKGTR